MGVPDEKMLGSTPSRRNRFLLVYGSATGQAQAIAEEIAEKAPKFGLWADVNSLEETGKKFNIEDEKCLVVVTSTTGDGDPPANAEKFMRRIKKRTLGSDYLAHLHYTMLGLGDTNYTNFCRCARDMDARLEVLGAKRFYPTGLADDGVGLEVVADPWLEGLYPALQKFLGVDPDSNISLTEDVKALTLTDSDKSEKLVTNGGDRVQTSSDSVSNGQIDPSDIKHGRTNSLSAPGAGQNTDEMITTTSPQTSTTDSQNSLSGTSGQSDSTDGLPNCTDSQPDSAYSSDTNIAMGSRSIDSVLLASDSVQNKNNSSNSPVQGSDVSIQTADLSLQSSNMASQSLINQMSPSQLSNNQDCLDTLYVPIPPADHSPRSALVQSSPPLSQQALTIPVMPPPFLKATFSNDHVEVSSLPHQNGLKLPCAASGVVHMPVISAYVLTAPDAVKKTLLLRLDLEGSGLTYCPGDSVSIICPNSQSEVDLLLDRLGLMSNADTTVTLSVMPDTQKRRAAVPPHIHLSSTLRHIFTTCVNIREPPSKAFIRALLEYTSDSGEVRRMQELCSKEGAPDYSSHVREWGITLLDFLYAFPSCCPPLERVLEHLPRLQPRPYSASSCLEHLPNRLDIVFNVVDIKADHGKGHYYDRRGVCTGWLDDVTSCLQTGKKVETEVKIPVFLRTNQHFRPPDDLSKPVIMIGPGTGVAPFIGFLQQRSLKRKDGPYGDTWLFYGCRNKDKDFLFREELERLEQEGTLSRLCVTFSRDPPHDVPTSTVTTPRYVQDKIRLLSSELCTLLTELDVLVYVCGDAKNMAKDVNQAFEDILQKEKGMSAEDAHLFMMKKRIKKTYLEDVWV